VEEFDLGIIATIYPDCAVNEIGDSEPFSLLSRTQIPLMAGYAITVHKAQVGFSSDPPIETR
jgi:ATP-dependent DNA helicase PIF1